MHWMLFPLRRYAEFSGRSRRREYWSFVLLNGHQRCDEGYRGRE